VALADSVLVSSPPGELVDAPLLSAVHSLGITRLVLTNSSTGHKTVGTRS
jgi:hypothetical protein